MRRSGDDDDGFTTSRAKFEQVVGFLDGEAARGLSHADLEDRLNIEGRELLRLLYQDHLDLRAERERRQGPVIDAGGVSRPSVEPGHTRSLTTIFGEVTVTRYAYRRPGHPNLHPADRALNLPEERHSHGVRRLAATQAARGSFDDATDAVRSTTGATVAKRQVEALAQRAAVDFEEFYATRPRPPADPEEVVVISVDGKGIVMRPEALRAATAAAKPPPSWRPAAKCEKRNRKRMAEVGAVYTAVPVPRTAADVLAAAADHHVTPKPAPKAKAKWVTASVVNDAATVVAEVFDGAEQRDPDHHRTWVAIVDGNNHQIERIRAEAARFYKSGPEYRAEPNRTQLSQSTLRTTSFPVRAHNGSPGGGHTHAWMCQDALSARVSDQR